MTGRPCLLLGCCAALALAACGGEETRVERERDPVLAAVLAMPIMTDPDLVGLNRANSAAAMPPSDMRLAIVDAGPEAVAAARADARRLVGGLGAIQTAPEPAEPGSASAAAALGVAARVITSLGTGGTCADRVEHSAVWAARLPPPFPVYPRGAVQEAAGTDKAGCALRVVAFVTPVPLGEVLDFYYTRARAAGFSARRTMQGGDDLLVGAKGENAYVVYARRVPSGNTAVDLVTRG